MTRTRHEYTDPPLERHLAERLAGMAALFNEGRHEGVGSYYAHDAVIVGFPLAGGPFEAVVGADALREAWRDSPGRRWELESLAVRERGEFAQQHGRSHLLVEVRGRPHRMSTEFVLLWRREADGVWRVYADVFKPVGGGVEASLAPER